MFCLKCGKDNPPDAKFCNECAFPLQEINRILSNSEISNTIIETKHRQDDPHELSQKQEDQLKPFVQTTSQPSILSLNEDSHHPFVSPIRLSDQPESSQPKIIEKISNDSQPSWYIPPVNNKPTSSTDKPSSKKINRINY
jgi:hypothetical protein